MASTQSGFLDFLGLFTQPHDNVCSAVSFPGKWEFIYALGQQYFGTFIGAGHRIATPSGCLPARRRHDNVCSAGTEATAVIEGYPCLAIVNRKNGFLHSSIFALK